MRSLALSVLLVVVVLGGAVAMPLALRTALGVEALGWSGLLAVLWGVLWARIFVWGLKRRARLLGSIPTRPDREKAT